MKLIRIIFSISLLSLLAQPVLANPMKLLDVAFSKKVCDGWNQTSLPKKVGRKGSGWIDSADSKGIQKIVVTRKDCKGWKKVQLVIKANEAGEAKCVEAGAFDGKAFQWKFEPSTVHWADFSDGFGAFKMPKIMSGFVGPYGTAMKNIGNFQIFFAMVGYVAQKNKVDWSCKGADMEDVNDEIKGIDQADMKAILKGMAVLKN